MTGTDTRRAGFKRRTRVAEARERLLAATEPHGRTERVRLVAADGRTLAADVAAERDVPGYERAAMDGFAVRAADTFGAAARSPAVLRVSGDDAGSGSDGAGEGPASVGPGEAVRVHTGSEVPAGADAVVMVESTERVGDEVEVLEAVAEGENVGAPDEDVAAGRALYEAGHRLRPSDLGLLKSVGVTRVPVAERPVVGVVPTGEELVQGDPDPGEVVETNGLTVSTLVERWGGAARYRDVVTDDADALRAAIQRDLTADVVVTTGGSSVGERDLVPDVVADLGELLVHGVALKPGHPAALGVVSGTPVLALPGYPVSCIVNAVQFLRPTLRRLAGAAEPTPEHPTVRARLERKVRSEPGTRTFARVRLAPETATDDGGAAGGAADADGGVDADDPAVPTATPTRTSGAGILSSVALADGWVVVPESVEGYPAGDVVDVQLWEWSA
jgi:molybdopterin molybdotransferase